jgi:hypothetical protein
MKFRSTKKSPFPASDASNFVNGHVLYVDGGVTAYPGKQPWSWAAAIWNQSPMRLGAWGTGFGKPQQETGQPLRTARFPV